MQNKPNLLNTQINVTSVIKKDYKNKPPLRAWQNKPNQTQSKPSSIPPPLGLLQLFAGDLIRRNLRRTLQDLKLLGTETS